ncbi:hypothetical protein BST97_03545 [Nonlabens spongiae]|uniref:Uncharacterized protein n=1 Tax=Nonlabens spongiae TaxID=331648 RepID=A0A1W6MI10_9FLAO|nr:hypothetical protein BST97_03545 [Nonlabens spongiae]
MTLTKILLIIFAFQLFGLQLIKVNKVILAEFLSNNLISAASIRYNLKKTNTMKTSAGFLNAGKETNNRTSNNVTFSDSWNSRRRYR